jgi:VanZ family protein
VATVRLLPPLALTGVTDDGLMNEQRPFWSWLFFAQLSLVILASVLATTGHFPVTALSRAPFDKLGHLLAYGGLSFFAVAFFGRRRRWWVIACLLVAATLEELSQRAFPRRTFDLGDLAMNIVGIWAFGTASARRLRGSRRQR